MPKENITPDQARDALLRSGYLTEYRVAALLEKRDYFVTRNAAFPDPITGKSRELDLWATVLPQLPTDDRLYWATLLVECVNNPQPVAFVTHEPPYPYLHKEEIKLCGIPIIYPDKQDRNSWISMAEWMKMDTFHHYCMGRVATQFCSFQKKKRTDKEEWMAHHDERHLDCLSKLADVAEYEEEEHFRRCAEKETKQHCQDIAIIYPLVVVQGDLLDVRPSKRSVRLVSAKHIQYRLSKRRNKDLYEYQIDVVTESFLPNYLDIVEYEVMKIDRLLRRRKKAVEEAVQLLSEKMKAKRKLEDKVAVLKTE